MKLLFDFGGVIVDLQREACLSAFDDLGFDLRPFLGTFQQGGVFAQLENGDIDVPTFCQSIRQLAGSHKLSDAQIIAAWESYLTGIPRERLQLLRNIHRHYPTYILSNTNPIHWQQSLHTWFEVDGHKMSDYFDGLFLSYELHLQKPDPRIFHHVIQAMGSEAQDILFLDDSEENCRVARSCGLQAVVAPAHGAWYPLFSDNGQLHEHLL